MRFSILIPAFKRKYLYEAINSCLSQTYGEYEVIIVDDASPEDLKSVVNQFNDPRIKYYRNDNNCGAVNVVDNWNISLSHANGDFVICMGDDDLLKPYCLEEYVNLINKYPGLEVYHAWTELIDENGTLYGLQAPRQEWESVYSLIWNRWNGRLNQFIGDFCFDTKALQNNGGFYKLPMAWGSDDISVVRAAITKGIANTQTICFQYRVNRHTISNTGDCRTKVDAILLERSWYRKLFDDILNNPQSPTDKTFLSCIKTSMPNYYRKKISSTIANDICNHPTHFIGWLRKSEKMEISKLQVFYCAVQAVSLRIKQFLRRTI